MENRHIMTVLVDNKPGVLSNVVGLFSGRGFNIESLNVAATDDSEVSRMTITTKADAMMVEQIEKQLNKLINVIKIRDLTDYENIQRELALITVTAKAGHKEEILRLAELFRAKVIDVGIDYYTIEITGNPQKMETFFGLIKPFGIKKVARTGPVALSRGAV